MLRINLKLDEHEAKVLRQILKERVAFCAKEEKVLKAQAHKLGYANHMYTQAYYATRTVKAKALYELVNREIHAGQQLERTLDCIDNLRPKPPISDLERYVDGIFTGSEYPTTCDPEMELEKLINQHPEE